MKKEYIHELYSELKSNTHVAEDNNIINIIIIDIEAYSKQQDHHFLTT